MLGRARGRANLHFSSSADRIVENSLTLTLVEQCTGAEGIDGLTVPS